MMRACPYWLVITIVIFKTLSSMVQSTESNTAETDLGSNSSFTFPPLSIPLENCHNGDVLGYLIYFGLFILAASLAWMPGYWSEVTGLFGEETDLPFIPLVGLGLTVLTIWRILILLLRGAVCEVVYTVEGVTLVFDRLLSNSRKQKQIGRDELFCLKASSVNSCVLVSARRHWPLYSSGGLKRIREAFKQRYFSNRQYYLNLDSAKIHDIYQALPRGQQAELVCAVINEGSEKSREEHIKQLLVEVTSEQKEKTAIVEAMRRSGCVVGAQNDEQVLADLEAWSKCCSRCGSETLHRVLLNNAAVSVNRITFPDLAVSFSDKMFERLHPAVNNSFSICAGCGLLLGQVDRKLLCSFINKDVGDS